MLVCIDPGVRTGWALFEEATLIGAGVNTPETLLHVQPWGRLVKRAILEHPRWYPRDHKDVNDLIDLASTKGKFEHLFEQKGVVVSDVWPRTWKGTVPKEVMTERIVSRLSAEEKLLVTYVRARSRRLKPEHNCVDAIGMGLWDCGRL